MKRSVAITGATPAFLRWAIWHPCELRPLDPYRFADQTFRKLRGIRELSIAKAESRCDDDFCFHPEAFEPNSPAVDHVRGFRREEIAAVFGGEDPVFASCLRCPANVLASRVEGVAAGCFGFMATTEFDLQRLMSGYSQGSSPEFDLVQSVQQAAEQIKIEPELSKWFGAGRIVWHRLWKQTILSRKQLAIVDQIFSTLVEANDKATIPDHVLDFARAVTACLQHEMRLHVELVPSGFADDETWKLNTACPDCKYEPELVKKLQKCVGCGRIGGMAEGQKFRVLGLRPYSVLAGIVGADRVSKALSELRD